MKIIAIVAPLLLLTGVTACEKKIEPSTPQTVCVGLAKQIVRSQRVKVRETSGDGQPYVTVTIDDPMGANGMTNKVLCEFGLWNQMAKHKMTHASIDGASLGDDELESLQLQAMVVWMKELNGN